LNEPPFNISYLPNHDTPLKWWNTCFSSQNRLQTLAIMLFSITPHVASCERVWSTIGWFYGKRRTKLGIKTIESLSKIHRFYLSNIKNELKHLQLAMDEDQIKELFQETLSESFEEFVEEDESSVLSSLREPDDNNFSNNNEESLNISSMFNLEPIVTIEYVDVSTLHVTNLDESENEEEFDITDLVNDILY
jgi:hypothetical protein